MKMKPIHINFVALFIGIGIGLMLPFGLNDSSNHEDFRSSKSGDQIARSEKRNDHSWGLPPMRSHTNTPEKKPRDSSSSESDSEEDLVMVPSALFENLNITAGANTVDAQLFGRDDRIEEALQITAHEKAVIQTAWTDIRGRIRDLEAASKETTVLDEWSVRITVPDLSASLESLGTDFNSALTRALGNQRSKTFQAFKQIDKVFSPAEGKKSYTITSESVGDGEWRYRMALDGPDGQRVWVGDSIPDEISHLCGDIRLDQ